MCQGSGNTIHSSKQSLKYPNGTGSKKNRNSQDDPVEINELLSHNHTANQALFNRAQTARSLFISHKCM